MPTKPIDSTTRILRSIQTDLATLRREVNERFRQVAERLDSIEEYLIGAVVNATEGRGIVERLRLRMKRLEDCK